jgi:limonene 1,2-monooxygenase
VDRANWRVNICLHLAETRKEAMEQVRGGMRRWFREYIKDTVGSDASLPEGREAEAAVETHTAIIGSVDDAIEAIERMLAESGGFGTLLVNTQDWATREQTRYSFELLARYVAPHFNGALDSRHASQRWVAENRADFSAQSHEAAKLAGR